MQGFDHNDTRNLMRGFEDDVVDEIDAHADKVTVSSKSPRVKSSVEGEFGDTGERDS